MLLGSEGSDGLRQTSVWKPNRLPARSPEAYLHNTGMLPKRVRHLIWSFVVGLGTLVYLVEEWLWDSLQSFMKRLGRLPLLRQLEAYIAGLSPVGAAVFFVLPATLALPVKLLALHAIAHGHWLKGAIVILAAKVLATALFARIYVLTQPALMQVSWFVRLHALFVRWRDWAYAQLQAHPLWARMHHSVRLWRLRRRTWRKRQRQLARKWWQRRTGG